MHGDRQRGIPHIGPSSSDGMIDLYGSGFGEAVISPKPLFITAELN